MAFNPSYVSTQKNAYCSANASITRRQPSSEIAATYLTSGENTKSVKRQTHTQLGHRSRYVPTRPRFDTFQWLTGFFVALSLSPLPPPAWAPAALTGCHGGIVTKILSNGFHSPASGLISWEGVGSLVRGRGGDARDAVGACGVNTPSSRSLS
jgi:hypothetical protein